MNEFRIFGQNLEKISAFYGVLLIVWGIVISLIGDSQAITSLIPTFFGLLVLLLGVLSLLMPSRRKLLMHLVAIVGVLIFLGGLDFLRSTFSSGLFSNPWADLSKLMMALTGFIFCFLCIKSFIFARKNL